MQNYAKTHKTRTLHDSSQCNVYLYFNRFFRWTTLKATSLGKQHQQLSTEIEMSPMLCSYHILLTREALSCISSDFGVVGMQWCNVRSCFYTRLVYARTSRTFWFLLCGCLAVRLSCYATEQRRIQNTSIGVFFNVDISCSFDIVSNSVDRVSVALAPALKAPAPQPLNLITVS